MKPKITEAPLPSSLEEARRFLVNRPFLASPRHKAQHWRAVRDDAHPDILAFERVFIRRFRKMGIPMFAHCIVRPDAVQMRHFVTGVSKARPGESPHNVGKAVDLVHGTRAWQVPKPCWDLMGHIGKEVAQQLGIKVVWGGDWRFYDPAHWELAGWDKYPATYRAAEDDEVRRLLDYYSGAEA